MQLTERQQQVLQAVLTQPDATLEDIAVQIGVSRQRVWQLYERLRDAGLQIDRKLHRKQAREQQRQEAKVAREQRKRMWRKMLFIGLRQRLRFMASIDHRGMVRGYHMPGEETICQFSGCTHPVRARGFCHVHYFTLRKTGALWVRRSSKYKCTEPDCYRPVYARDVCQAHYEQMRRRMPFDSHLPNHNTSGFRGVSRSKYGTYITYIRNPEGKMEYLGTFKESETAARAYDTAAREYHGARAKLNFPNEQIRVEKQKKKGASGEPGVTWNEQRHRWRVRITRDGKSIYVGSFLDLDEAIQARNTALAEQSTMALDAA